MQCLVDGRAVHVECAMQQTEAPAIVLLHGAASDHRAWRPLLPGLRAAGFAVYAPDLPAHGASAGPPCTSVAQLATWLLAMLDACGIARCALAGHSMGSLLALHAAALAPGRITHLALVGTASPMRVAPALLELARAQPDAALHKMATWSFRQQDGRPLSPEDSAQALTRMREVQAGWSPGDLLATDLALCDAYAEAEVSASHVRASVAFILGEHDRMTPVKATQRLQDVLPQASVTVLDSGHELMTEATDGVLRALLDLLQRPPAARSQA